MKLTDQERRLLEVVRQAPSSYRASDVAATLGWQQDEVIRVACQLMSYGYVGIGSALDGEQWIRRSPTALTALKV